MIELKAVSKFYTKQCIFSRFDYRFDQSCTLISGPNGCGKTTLLMLMAGIISADDGQILLDGEDVQQPDTQRHIGISCSRIQLPDFLSARQVLEFHCQQRAGNWPETLIEQFQFSPYLATQVAALSLGNYKKLSLLTALLHQPKLLLLDEPGNGLDDQAIAVLQQVISDYSGQVVVASHEQHIVEQPGQHLVMQRSA